ncbi:MAG: L-threonylcarbamoyladenylate synthase [Candidatus Omnitrophota bacterium]
MKPQVIKIDPQKINTWLIRRAAGVIRRGGLVAFPTETVYGLGANALNPEAVTGIFAAKERPLDDPLIVHIAFEEELYKLAEEVPEEAKKLIKEFWPGPLTVVLKKTEVVPDIVTTGLDTVAIRMPSNAISRELISMSGVPIAAPSANLFGRPSPTKAQHVIYDLDGRIDLILDGGPTEIGIESTVVEFIEGKVIVLRPGGIDVESLHSVIGNVHVYSGPEISKKSPGKYPQHYSPKAKVLVVEDGDSQVGDVKMVVQNMIRKKKKVGIMAKKEHADEYSRFDVKILGPRNNGKKCASNLFHILREFDSENMDVIIAEAIPERGLGLAVMNRLHKAAGTPGVQGSE